ncbi:cytochrome P450 71A1-like [Sesbania bispinosa]|nr:cytochrome P450 71A1-like [Sesbania bispinosa]
MASSTHCDFSFGTTTPQVGDMDKVITSLLKKKKVYLKKLDSHKQQVIALTQKV